MSRLRIFPPVVTIYPGDRQLFTAQAEPPPPMWVGVTGSGDIKSDYSLEVDPAGSAVDGIGALRLLSGIGFVEITIDDQCRPTSTNVFYITGFIADVNNFLYLYQLKINSSTVEVRDEANVQIYTESYTAVSGDVYRLELSSAFRFYRNGVLKHSRTGLGTAVKYPMGYSSGIQESTAAAPTRIPPPRLIGDWGLIGDVVWSVSHGITSELVPALSTDYYNGTTPGTHTLTGQIESAADAGGVQKATATIIIPPLQVLSPTEITMLPGQKTRFKTNYDAAQTGGLVAWSVISGGGSFTQGEFTAPATVGTTVVRATAAINNQSADITITIAPVISNANNYTAAKVSEQIDFEHNYSLIPRFIGAGGAVSGTGDITPGFPFDLQVNDVCFLFVETANQTVSTPTDWAVVADSPQGTGTGGDVAATRLSIFWRRIAAGVAPITPPTITDPGDHCIAQIMSFRGVIASGNPWDVTAGNTAGSSTSISMPGDTTTVANCLIVQAVAHGLDVATGQVSGYTNADLANILERSDVAAIDGNGGGFAVITGEKAAAGAFGATTATLASAFAQGRITIALKPDVFTWSASAGSINSSSGLWTAPSLAGQVAKITVTAGNLIVTLDVPVLKAFPYDPTATIALDRRKTVLIATAEDRTRTSRVKDKEGKAFESFELKFLNKTVAELNDITAFFDEHYPGVRFIVEEKVRTVRRVGYFDSDLKIEAGNACDVDVSFRFVEG